MLIHSRLAPILLFLILIPLRAEAQQPVYLWGFQQGCEYLPDASRYVEKHLHTAERPVALLHAPDGKPLPPCQGEQCAQILRRACPAAAGRLLGGQVSQGRDLTRFRLWLYDLSTGQTAWQDDYFENLAFDGALISQARALIENPRFGAAAGPGPKPAYCTSARPSPSDSESKGSIFLTVYGDGKHKAALLSAMREQLQLLGRTVLPVATETRSSTLDLQKIVSGQQNARVLGAEVKKDGTVDLFFYDQKTDRTTDKSLARPRPSRDESASGASAESLIVAVKQAVSELLGHCFTDQCAQNGMQPPVEACEAFAEAQCGGLGEMLVPGTGLPARHIDPTTAKVVKGALWGLFAASAATGISFFAAGSTPALQSLGSDHSHGNVWTAPAAAMVGIAALSLAVAIPTTVMVNRGQRDPMAAVSGTGPASTIQCPN